jgi:3-deoxy-7-phosphoheptulonate synthase
VAVPEDSLKLTNINVVDHHILPTPGQIREELNPSTQAFGVVAKGRDTIQAILDGEDPRRFVVIGPCSIHEVAGAMDYARRLKQLADRVADQLILVMRVYFEKPRTTVGWKGLINDPHMDDSFDIEAGIKIARGLLMDLAELGLPTATEALDPIVPQYISDLISWIAIGARTTESQTHRELASGLSTPVGFKNGTDGNIQVAINAMKSALSPHSFLGVDSEGRIAVYKTKGNIYNHVVLRGGKEPNYDPASVAQCLELLKKEGLRQKLMIDCSHGNSQKNHRNQTTVFHNVLDQMISGNSALCSWMVESNLEEGSQEIPQDLRQLKYGVSVTDKCIDWDTTEQMILEAHKKLS